MNFEDVRGPGELDPDLVEDRHQPLAEGSELLFGVPDLTHLEIVFRSEEDMKLAAVRGPLTRLFEPTQTLFVLLLRDVRG